MRWLPLAEVPVAPGTSKGLSAQGAPDLETRLGGVAGLDVAYAMQCVGGQVAILERILRTFVRTYADGAPALLTTADQNAASKWLAATHSLIGATGAVGARALCEDLRRFEHELGSGRELPDLAKRAQQINADLKSFVERLRLAL